MKYKRIDPFYVALEQLEDTEGYGVISLDEEKQYAEVFHFETKEEFDKYFEIKKHPYYPGNTLEPKLDEHEELVIDGTGYYVNENEVYLVIDGELQS
jgi:hypothetical protein